MEVYYYLPLSEVYTAIECGISLSKNYSKEVLIEGRVKRCISTLLNPKDDLKSYKCEELKCVKIDVPPKYCYIADRRLYEVGLENERVMEKYNKSIIPAEKYIFGTYRMPECLVMTTILGEQISLLNKNIDSPVLVDDSERLYVNNLIEEFKDKNDYFYDELLYHYMDKYAEDGKLQKFVNRAGNYAVFYDEAEDRSYTLRVPDFRKVIF